MAVNVFVKVTGQQFTGKFALVEGDQVSLYPGVLPDGKGGFRGCGKKTTFPAQEVEVLAHQPDIEIRTR